MLRQPAIELEPVNAVNRFQWKTEREWCGPNKPRECNAVRHSCVPPPPYRHYRHCCPPPDHSPLFASIRWPGQGDLTSAGSVAAGSDGFLLGRIHFPCGYVVYVLLCCWGVFPVLTLYSPRSIVWGLFFSPPFPHVNSVFFFNSTCISLLIILVWLCMWRIIKNLEMSRCRNRILQCLWTK